MKLKLGTRKSLLALAQSSWVARQIESKNPGIEVELVGIETTGDRVLDVPLSKIEGKEFFVAELDCALRDKKVDFNVHSMKDLSLDRPKEFTLGAIPERENSRDVVFFHERIFEKIKQGKEIVIGTSSPRRLENVPALLSKILPVIGGVHAKLKFSEIRGNINTRLSRLHESEFSGRQLDGVVLACAGIARLYQDERGKEELNRLFKNTRKMILPLRENPTAPAQGALAIECRTQDESVIKVLKSIHHEPTAQNVAQERKVLQSWGGGCHQRFGASVEEHVYCGSMLYIRGELPNFQKIQEVHWKSPQKTRTFQQPWNGAQWRSKLDENLKHANVHSEDKVFEKEELVFVAHSRAWAWPSSPQGRQQCTLWTSGIESWKRLAEHGLWVEGCLEEYGLQRGLGLMDMPWLQHPKARTLLTHQAAVPKLSTMKAKGWNICATYKAPTEDKDYPEDAIKALKLSDAVFWSSASQYKGLKEYVTNENAVHACRAGRTYEELMKVSNGHVIAFPNENAWKVWVK